MKKLKKTKAEKITVKNITMIGKAFLDNDEVFQYFKVDGRKFLTCVYLCDHELGETVPSLKDRKDLALTEYYCITSEWEQEDLDGWEKHPDEDEYDKAYNEAFHRMHENNLHL